MEIDTPTSTYPTPSASPPTYPPTLPSAPQKRLRTISTSHQPAYHPQIAQAPELHHRSHNAPQAFDPHGGLVMSWTPHSWPPTPRDEDDSAYVQAFHIQPVAGPSVRKRKAGEEDAEAVQRSSAIEKAELAVIEVITQQWEKQSEMTETPPPTSLSHLASILLHRDMDAWRKIFSSLAVRELTRIIPSADLRYLNTCSTGEALAISFRWIHALEDSAPLQESWQTGVGLSGGWTLQQSWTFYHSVVQGLLMWHLDSHGVSPALVGALRALF